MISYERANRPIPRFDTVRRVPPRYRYVLPLDIIKRHRCLVLGSAHGVLTVAVTDTENRSLIDTLEKLTGHRIFTVLIEPTRMQMLIERLERSSIPRYTRQALGRPCYLHRVQLTAIVWTLSNIK